MKKDRLWKIFENTVENNSDRVAVKYAGHEYTYKEYIDDINKVAGMLVKEYALGLEDIVIIYAENSYMYACYVMACIKLGVIIAPINVKVNEMEVYNIAQQCVPKQIFTDQDWLLGTTWASAIELKEPPMSVYMGTDMSAAPDYQFILFSSGSTGEIKGIECTEKGIIAATYAINDVIGNTCKDNILCILDFSFDYGLYQLFLAYEVGAAVTIYSAHDNILRIPDYIFKNKITGFPATPFLLKMLWETKRITAEKLVSLRSITSTGDHLSPELIDVYKDMLPNARIFPMYGLTECKRVSILRPEEYETHRNSVGRPLSCSKVKIVDTDGKEVSYGTVGELVVTGKNVMRGYFKDEELTRRKFVRNQEGIVELYTGDNFIQDEEGFLYFVSRTQNFIKIRERRISPLTIEWEIKNCTEGIIECLVVPIHNSCSQDEIFCFLRLEEGYDIGHIVKECEKKITRIYLPHFFCDYKIMFPHNANGKIERAQMMRVARQIVNSGECVRSCL